MARILVDHTPQSYIEWMAQSWPATSGHLPLRFLIQILNRPDHGELVRSKECIAWGGMAAGHGLSSAHTDKTLPLKVGPDSLFLICPTVLWDHSTLKGRSPSGLAHCAGWRGHFSLELPEPKPCILRGFSWYLPPLLSTCWIICTTEIYTKASLTPRGKKKKKSHWIIL